MKKLTAIILGTFMLTGCSHAYIVASNKDKIEACCPNNKIFCKESALEDIAKDHCDGDVKVIQQGTRGLNSYSIRENDAGFFGTHVSVSQDTETCAIFSCGITGPAPASYPIN